MSRKLDAAIAGALGYEVFWVDDMPRYKSKDCKSWPAKPVKRYSTSGNAMLLLLEEELWERGWVVMLTTHSFPKGKVTAYYFQSGKTDFSLSDSVVRAGTMPLAVALAAYKALTGEGWEE